MPITLTWYVRNNNIIYPLNIDLTNQRFDNLEGIYVIWYETRLGYFQAVYVGQGEIRNRLYSHRIGNISERHASEHLYVIWAKESSSKETREGIEQYLHDLLNPLESKPQNVTPIQVNWPEGLPPIQL